MKFGPKIEVCLCLPELRTQAVISDSVVVGTEAWRSIFGLSY